MSQKIVVVYGAATLGQELVQAVATAGCEVILVDHSEEKLKKGLARVEAALDAEIARWGLTSSEKRAIMSRIKSSTQVSEAAKGWLVIETLKETLEVKRQLFKELDAICKPDTILASNSATISITEISSGCSYPQRTIAMHFQSPIVKVPLVEISRGLMTDDTTYEAAVRFANMMRKTVISVYDCPGFVTTRIVLPMINQAVKVLEEGIAPCEQIDTAMKLGFGLNTGPLALADKIGIDTVVFYLENLYTETFDQSYLPAKLLKKMTRAGYKGVKSNHGFYRYGEDGMRTENSGLKVEQLSQAGVR
ncbi:MAG: 3-hydroxybutyryl-CoA dehydrogenase [Candidatus Riflebacteria bacterium HGW-Riflebacteria-2]|jgi:3-hydroxybutyryl-CoA dehydrogenase|nr:MAG: 3-hydroxybutyryl-CoA dehydrogenase [Candidatus Riflebacteria bacterium HGW-Riflebacteria-2]